MHAILAALLAVAAVPARASDTLEATPPDPVLHVGQPTGETPSPPVPGSPDTNPTPAHAVRDVFDIGAGLSAGFPWILGAKVRLLKTHPSGITGGVDLGFNTYGLNTQVYATGLIGYRFEGRRHVFRPYLTGGAYAHDRGWGALAGAGGEWKPARWFGFGFEGGVDYLYWDDNGYGHANPFVRVTFLFYVL